MQRPAYLYPDKNDERVLGIACFLIAGIQLLYLILFLIQFLKDKKPVSTDRQQPVSVIICAHDEEQNLRELIPILNDQQYPDFEIIIVEDRCNDGTFDYLMEAARIYPRVRMVRVQHLPENMNGKKFGLTLGIRAARHEIILLTDADCRPHSRSWIARMSEQFAADTQIVIGFSGYEKRDGLLNSFIRFETMMTGIQYIAFAWMGMPYMGVGRNLAYRKSLFLENKGFNNQLSITGGDDDLFVNEHATRSNTRVAAGAESLVYSAPKTTLREFYYQKIRHLSVGKRYRGSTILVLGLFMESWLLMWLFVIPAAFFTPYLYWIAGMAGIRWLLFISLTDRASRQLGDRFEGWKTPFLEFIYTFYYLVAGAVALVSKKVRWKI